MGAKVTFNELTKIIEIDEAPDVDGEVFIDVKTDLYSDGKEDWVAGENLRKFQFPISAVGGNPLPGEKALGSTFFLNSDWKIRPYNASHRLTINGNFYSADGTDPFLDPIGTFTVRIMQQVSSLVDSTVQQLAEIEYASYGGGVTVDVLSSYTGTDYPVGTPQQPVNNMFDALDIANDRGFVVFFITGDITLDDSLDFSQFTFIGESAGKSEITIDPDANVEKCEFYEATIQGTLDGNCKIKECTILDVNYISGIVELCVIAGEILLGGGAEAYFLDCWAGTNLGVPPSIDMGGSGQTLVMQNFNGYIQWKNKSGPDQANASLNAGWIVLDPTITAGMVNIIGVGTVDDYSTGTTMVNIEHLVNPDNVSNHVWNDILVNHATPGSYGKELATKADIVASTSTIQTTAISGSVINGLVVSGDLSSTYNRDNTYWQIQEDAADGITVEFVFNLPAVDRAGVFSIFGRYEGQPASSHYMELWGWNVEAVAWELLVEIFMLGGHTTDDLFEYEYFERNIDRDNNNEVKFRTVHHITSYVGTHNQFIDYAQVTSIAVITPEDTANAVWDHINGLKLLGLVQENFVMDQQIYEDYNGAKLLTSARIRTYEDSLKTQLIATYQVTSAWSNGQCTSYEMVIV